MVNKPLISPYFWGGYVRGGTLTSHEYIFNPGPPIFQQIAMLDDYRECTKKKTSWISPSTELSGAGYRFHPPTMQLRRRQLSGFGWDSHVHRHSASLHGLEPQGVRRVHQKFTPGKDDIPIPAWFIRILVV